MAKTKFRHIAAALCLTVTLVTGCGESRKSIDDGASSPLSANPITAAEPGGYGNIEETVISSGDQYAIMTIKDYGEIKLKLYPEYAPVAVKNFVDLAESGYYDGKKVHRVLPNFMMQGGSKNGDGLSDGEGESFSIETNPKMRHFYGALCMAKDGLGRVGAQFYIVNSKNKSEFQELYDNLVGLEANANAAKAEYEQAKSAYEQGQLDEGNYTYYKTLYETRNALYESIKNATPDIVEKYNKVGGTPQLDGGYTVFGQAVGGFGIIDRIAAVERIESGGEEPSKPKEDIIIESVKIFTEE